MKEAAADMPADTPARSHALEFRVVATSFLTLFSIVGLSYYGLPFYYDFMVKEFGWSRTQVMSGNALGRLLVGPLFGFVAGWMVDRYGPRRLMLVGVLLVGVALVGLAGMTALWMFYLFFLLNALGYVFGGPLPNQVLLSRWFTKARGRAMGYAYLGIGLGGVAVPLLSHWLTEQFGWHAALGTVGVLAVVIALPPVFFVKESPGEAEARAGAGASAPVREVFGGRSFYLLAIGSMCSIGVVGAVTQHLKLFLSLDQGYAQGEAARIASVLLASSLVGRVLMGWLADRYAKKRVMIGIYLLVASALPLLFFPSPGTIYLFAVVFGVGLGGDYMIIPLMAAELFGVRVLGRVMGVILTADGLAEALTPMLVGWTYDVTRGYASGFLILIVMALTGAAMIMLLPNRGAASPPSG